MYIEGRRSLVLSFVHSPGPTGQEIPDVSSPQYTDNTFRQHPSPLVEYLYGTGAEPAEELHIHSGPLDVVEAPYTYQSGAYASSRS